jgi:hypothetical protein
MEATLTSSRSCKTYEGISTGTADAAYMVAKKRRSDCCIVARISNETMKASVSYHDEALGVNILHRKEQAAARRRPTMPLQSA